MKNITDLMTKLSISEGKDKQLCEAELKLAVARGFAELLRSKITYPTAKEKYIGKIYGVLDDSKMGNQTDVSNLVAGLREDSSIDDFKKALATTVLFIGRGLSSDLEKYKDAKEGIDRNLSKAPVTPFEVCGYSSSDGKTINYNKDYEPYYYIPEYEGEQVIGYRNKHQKTNPDHDIVVTMDDDGEVTGIKFGAAALGAVIGKKAAGVDYSSDMAFTRLEKDVDLYQRFVGGAKSSSDIIRQVSGDNFTGIVDVAKNTATMLAYRVISEGNPEKTADALKNKKDQDKMTGVHSCGGCTVPGKVCVSRADAAFSGRERLPSW